MADIYVDNATPGSNTSPYDTWAKAATTLATALAIATSADTVWVKNTHNETQSTTNALTFPTSAGLKVLCTSDTSQPPTSVTTGGLLRTSATGVISLDGFAYIYGLEFRPGEGNNTSSPQLNIGSTIVAQGLVLDTCKGTMASTGSALMQLCGGASGSAREYYVELINFTAKFGAVGQSIAFRNGRQRIKNMSIDAAGSAPTSLFKFTVGCNSDTLVEASDLSGKAWTNLANVGVNAGGRLTVRNCKLPSSITVVTGTNPDTAGPIVRMHNCDSGNTNYRFSEQYYEGSIVNENTIVKTGGSSDGVTPESFKMVSSANTQIWTPLRSPEFVQKVTTTGSALTCTVDIMHDNVTGLKDNEVWLELEYLSDSGTPLGTYTTDRASSVIASGSTQPSSSASWTTTGITNPNAQKLQITFTPQQKGYVICRVALAKASYTVYVDFEPTIA